MLLYNSIWGVGSLSQGFQAKKNGIRQVGFVPPPPSPSIGVGISDLFCRFPTGLSMLGLPAVTLQDASKFQQHMEHKKKTADHGIHYTPYSIEKYHPYRWVWKRIWPVPIVSQGFPKGFPMFPSDCLGGATLQNWDLRTGCAVKGATVMIHYIYIIFMTIYSMIYPLVI